MDWLTSNILQGEGNLLPFQLEFNAANIGTMITLFRISPFGLIRIDEFRATEKTCSTAIYATINRRFI